MNMKLIITIVPHGEGERITYIMRKNGAKGGTILMGRGTAENSFLLLLGIGDTSKDIVFTLVEEDAAVPMIQKLYEEVLHFKAHYGITFSLNADNGLPLPTNYNKECLTMEAKTHKLITAILNKDYADDAMVAARKAGAGGGTIVHGRGTATEADVSFLGMTIVPEKEILMILVEKEKSASVMEAIQNCPCLKEPGSGIVYSVDVDNFTFLGKRN